MELNSLQHIFVAFFQMILCAFALITQFINTHTLHIHCRMMRFSDIYDYAQIHRHPTHIINLQLTSAACQAKQTYHHCVKTNSQENTENDTFNVVSPVSILSI